MALKKKIFWHCFIHGSIWVATLCAFLFIGSRTFLDRTLVQLTPVCGDGVWSDQAQNQMSILCQSLQNLKPWLSPVIFGSGLAALVFMGFSLRWALIRVIAAAEDEGICKKDPDARKREPSAAAHKEEKSPAPPSAASILALFQSQGRLIDFLQEDLSQYQDDQIGAAVRNIHQGCREVLKECMTLNPVMKEPEGSEVNVEAGFDPSAVKLIGNVSGQPPFRGILRHRGWRYSRLEIPISQARQDPAVIAPAEVEIL